MAAAVVLGSLAVLTADPRPAQAACATGSSVIISSPSTSSTNTLSGIFTLKAQAMPTTPSGLSFMLLPSNAPLGEGVLKGSEWDLDWDTRNQPNGSYQVMAVAHYGTDATLDCASAAVPVSLYNQASQTPQLVASVSPNSFQLTPGAMQSFAIDAVYTDQYGRSSHVTPSGVNWASNVGTAAPNGGATTVFTAGPILTSGLLSADVAYAGLMTHTAVQIKVIAPTSSTATPTPSPTPKPTATASPLPTAEPLSSDSEFSDSLTAAPTIFRPASPTNADPLVSSETLECIRKTAGAVRFSEISSGKSQPTMSERKAAANCFTGAPIPAVLAPVAPSHLTELPTTTDLVAVSSIQNQTVISKDGKKTNGLLLSGKGAPNSTVFIYIFSDPLVLRAQTNSSGTWNYVLETPLPSGHHEVYAVAEKDSDTFVRTSAVPISIAAAAPGSQDGSLVIERGWSPAQMGFAAGAALMVLAAIGIFFTVIRRRRRHVPAAPTVILPDEPQA